MKVKRHREDRLPDEFRKDARGPKRRKEYRDIFTGEDRHTFAPKDFWLWRKWY